jgi:hypothetical protein
MLKDRLKTGQMPWPVTFVMFWQLRRGFAEIAEAPAWVSTVPVRLLGRSPP